MTRNCSTTQYRFDQEMDPYTVLNVAKNATDIDIKKAFRKLALRHHPDRSTPNEKASSEAKMVEINQAYSILKDPVSRAEYDRQTKYNTPYRDSFMPYTQRNRYHGTDDIGGFHFQFTSTSNIIESGKKVIIRTTTIYSNGKKRTKTERTAINNDGTIQHSLEENDDELENPLPRILTKIFSLRTKSTVDASNENERQSEGTGVSWFGNILGKFRECACPSFVM